MKNLKFPIVLVLLASVGTNQASAKNAPDQALLKLYTEKMSDCAFKNVTKLDDLISSADVVGEAVFEFCKMNNGELAQKVMAKTSNAYFSGYSRAQRKWFVGLVLYVRTHRDEIAKGASMAEGGGLY
jgi:hypothetical protein